MRIFNNLPFIRNTVKRKNQKSDKMLICFFLIFSLSIEEKIQENQSNQLNSPLEENKISDQSNDDEDIEQIRKQIEKGEREAAKQNGEDFDADTDKENQIPDVENKEGVKIENENSEDIQKEAPKIEKNPENDAEAKQETVSIDSEPELNKDSEKEAQKQEETKQENQNLETEQNKAISEQNPSKIVDSKAKSEVQLPDMSIDIDHIDEGKEIIEEAEEKVKLEKLQKGRPGVNGKNEKNEKIKEETEPTQKKIEKKPKQQRITKKKPINEKTKTKQNEDKTTQKKIETDEEDVKQEDEQNDDPQYNQEYLNFYKMSPEEQQRYLQDAENQMKWQQYQQQLAEQYRYQQELEQMRRYQEAQDQYQIPIKLPKTFTDKRTGEVYPFPQSQEEYDQLSPRLQKAVRTLVRKLKRMINEYYQQYEQQEMYNNPDYNQPQNDPFYNNNYGYQQQWPDYNQQRPLIPFNDNDEIISDKNKDDNLIQTSSDKITQKDGQQTDFHTKQEGEHELRQPKHGQSMPLLNHRFNPNAPDQSSQLPPNTELDGMRRVTCMPGYVGNNPVDKYGCWKCTDECHPLADCVYPGRCACSKFYSGDGVIRCVAPIPYIISANKVKSGVDVKYVGIDKDFKLHNIFCRYDQEILPAVSINSSSSSVICPSPPADKPINALSISLDKFSWSDSTNIKSGFVFLEGFDFNNVLFYGGLIILIIVCGKVITLLIGCGKKSAKDRIDDMLPLMAMQQGNSPVTDYERDNNMA